MGEQVEVLITGAGASGLTLAIELARRGVTFRLIDKLDAPFAGSRGKGIQPRTQEIFEDLGILNRAVAAGGMYPAQREYAPDGSYKDSAVVEPQAATPSEPYLLALMLPQLITERIMRDRLQEHGQRPEFGCELVAFSQDAQGVTAQLRTKQGEQQLRARFLVAADGGRSFVRHALDIGFPGKTLGVRAAVADIALSGLSRDFWHRFGEGDMQNQLALCPLAGTDLFQLQAPVPLDGKGEVDLSVAGLNNMIAQRSKRDDIRVQTVSWASAYNMNARLADHYRVDNVFLVGDAAHIHPPTGGQGLNTSVQDSYNLAWKLAAVLRNQAPDALLDSYEQERRPIAASMLGLSAKLLDAMKKGELRRAREVNQLDLGYPDSALSLELPERKQGLLAGDRAPDAQLTGAAGQPIRLFNLFQGTHWTLLGYQTDNLIQPLAGLHIHSIGPSCELIDTNNQIPGVYGLNPGDLFLIRPDGYIGAILATAYLTALPAYLVSVGLVASP